MAEPPIEIPANFRQRVRAAHGAAGEAWLRALPEVIAELAARWRVTVGEPFALSFNFVAEARQVDGGEAVIKIGPWGDEARQEIAGLRLYDGDGACRLLAADAERGALLVERLRPGTMLAEVAGEDDDAATRIAAGLLRRLWRPVDGPPAAPGLRPLAEWFRAFERHRARDGGPGPLPEALLARAEADAAELLASAPRQVLLHADFHHTNVLSSARGWLAIDPKGMVGDPGYDVGPFLLNPDPSVPKPAALLRRRLDILADELAYDRARLRTWAFVHAVLSACWSAEDFGDGWQGAVASAEQALLA